MLVKCKVGGYIKVHQLGLHQGAQPQQEGVSQTMSPPPSGIYGIPPILLETCGGDLIDNVVV